MVTAMLKAETEEVSIDKDEKGMSPSVISFLRLSRWAEKVGLRSPTRNQTCTQR